MLGSLSEREYAKTLQKFIYDSKGCITGWDKMPDKTTKNLIEFGCELEGNDKEQNVADIHYIREKLIPDLEKNYEGVLSLDDKLDTTEEMTIYFD
jgi:hypothetical protein